MPLLLNRAKIINGMRSLPIFKIHLTFDALGDDLTIKPLNNLKVLAKFEIRFTTDHISPAGNIARNSPAARYLSENGVDYQEFNSYGSRRGNHEVMMRGTLLIFVSK